MLASAMAMSARMLVVRRTTCRTVGGMRVARTGCSAGIAVRTVAIHVRAPQELPEQNETGSDQKQNPDARHCEPREIDTSAGTGRRSRLAGFF